MNDTVKAVIFIKDAINLSQDELKEKFKQAVGLMLNNYLVDQDAD